MIINQSRKLTMIWNPLQGKMALPIVSLSKPIQDKYRTKYDTKNLDFSA
jgi:hypothetical protein